MSGSTQTQIVQVEDLLRSYGDQFAVSEHEAASTSSWSFDSRPIVAACLALLVFAPGCAAAAVFLMRADGNIPPVVTPASNPPFVAKTDRLPLEQWGIEAAQILGTKSDGRFAAASAIEDPAFLSPIMIRGSLEGGTITTFADTTSASILEPGASPLKPRFKRDMRRSKPAKVVAALTPPPEPPPQPSFFEKIFGTRTN